MTTAGLLGCFAGGFVGAVFAFIAGLRMGVAVGLNRCRYMTRKEFERMRDEDDD